MKLLVAAATIIGFTTISSADEFGFTVNDPVIVRIAGSDLEAIGNIQVSNYSIYIKDYYPEGLKRINESELYLWYAYHYAQQICYGRRTGEPFTTEDSSTEPLPEMIRLASAGLNGLVFEFSCSNSG